MWYDGSGTLLRRHVHGPAVDEPLVSYDGAGTSNRAWLIADQLGSVVASTNASAVATTINSYDEFGRPGAGNGGLFGFTGQMNLAAAGLYHYRARAYDPALGRFLQADPILLGGGINLYAYVANDPVNAIDPLGLQAWQDDDDDEIVVPGIRICPRGAQCITDPGQVRQFLEELTQYLARDLGNRLARILVRALVEAAQEAQCAAADLGFSIIGAPEWAFQFLPGNSTFTSIGAQAGGQFLGAIGGSATRYTNRESGQRTYSYSVYGFAGSTVSRGQPIPQGVADSASGRRLGLAGGLIWGTSQNTGSPVSLGASIYGPISGQLSLAGDAFSAGIGPGFGFAAGVSAAPVSIELACGGE